MDNNSSCIFTGVAGINKVDFNKAGIIPITTDENSNAVAKMIENILPILKGNTLNQIHEAFKGCRSIITHNVIIN